MAPRGGSTIPAATMRGALRAYAARQSAPVDSACCCQSCERVAEIEAQLPTDIPDSLRSIAIRAVRLDQRWRDIEEEHQAALEEWDVSMGELRRDRLAAQADPATRAWIDRVLRTDTLPQWAWDLLPDGCDLEEAS